MTDKVQLETVIAASPERVWQALTEPRIVKQYFFGADVDTDWRPGSAIIWRGEYEGRGFEDKGKVLEVEPNRRLVVTHWSPLSGLEDKQANYHTVSWEIVPQGDGSKLTLTQQNLTGAAPEQAKKKLGAGDGRTEARARDLISGARLATGRRVGYEHCWPRAGGASFFARMPKPAPAALR